MCSVFADAFERIMQDTAYRLDALLGMWSQELFNDSRIALYHEALDMWHSINSSVAKVNVKLYKKRNQSSFILAFDNLIRYKIDTLSKFSS